MFLWRVMAERSFIFHSSGGSVTRGGGPWAARVISLLRAWQRKILESFENCPS